MSGQTPSDAEQVLPTFLLVGAQKSATTSLFRYLGAHPDVFLSTPKEPDFFTAERAWPRGLDWYRSLFEPGRGTPARGEASTTYSMHPHHAGVPERIASVVPDVRLVYLLRHPVERACSDYVHHAWPPAGPARQYFERERRPIERALLEDPLYLDTSRYAMQLERYLEVVPRDRILVLTTDELDPERRTATIARTLAFLGVDPALAPAAESAEHNRTPDLRVPRPTWERLITAPVTGPVLRAAPWRFRRAVGTRRVPAGAGEMPAWLRQEVADQLRDDVVRLRVHLGSDFHCWGLA